MNSRYQTLAAVVLCAAAAGACSSDNSNTGGTTTPDATVTADAAASAGSIITSDVSMMIPPAGSIVDAIPGGSPDPTAGCSFATDHYICIISTNNFHDSTTVTAFDASGNAQTMYDDNTTASLHYSGVASGSVTIGSFQATLARHRQLVLSGLAGLESTRGWNGTGSDTLQVTFTGGAGGTRSYTATANTTVAGVIVNISAAVAQWPTSGSITEQLGLNATAGPDAGNSYSIQARVTFNGTADVPLTVGSTNYTLDLSTGTVTAQ